MIDIKSSFKEQGDDVHLLIIHSTKDALAQQAVDLLKKNVEGKGILIEERRIATLQDLVAPHCSAQNPNIVLIVAHGDKKTNRLWLFGDTSQDGRAIGTDIGLLKTALDGLLDDCLCLFGVCHMGQDLLKTAIVDQGGALACVAPKPGCTVSVSDIADEFAELLKEIQNRKQLRVGVDEIDCLLKKTFSADLYNRMALYTAAG